MKTLILHSKYMLLLFLFLIGISGCTKDLYDTDPGGSSSLRPLALRSSNSFLHVSYTLELTTLVKVEGELRDLDQIAATPMLSRQHVDFQLDELGNYQVEITKLSDARANLFASESPPSNIPEITKTVLSGNQLYMYKGDGSLIHTETVDPIPLPSFANLLQEGVEGISQQKLDQILSCLTQNIPTDTLMAFINHPPTGVVVQTLQTGIVSILIPVPLDSISFSVYSSVHLVDITNKRLLGSRLYDDQDNVLMCRMYNYDECNLTAFTEESIEELPSGETVIVRTIGRIDGLSVSIVN